MNKTQAFRHLILILTVGLLASACSATRIAYQNADSLIAGYAEKHLDLTDGQSEELRTRLSEWLAWHRREQLPELREQLRLIEAQVADGLTDEEAAMLVQSVRGAYKSVFAGLVPISAELFVSLTPQQLDDLEKAFAESNEEYRDDLLGADDETRHAERLRWFTRQAERWVGDLDDAQREWLKLQLLRYPSTAEEWLQYRIAQQRQLMALLRDGATVSEIERFLLGWTVERRGLSSSLAASRERLLGDAPRLLRVFDSGLSARQRDHWLERLAVYRELIDRMILPPAEQSTAGLRK